MFALYRVAAKRAMPPRRKKRGTGIQRPLAFKTIQQLSGNGAGFSLPGGHGAGFGNFIKKAATAAATAAAHHVVAEIKKDPGAALAKARQITGLGGRRKKRRGRGGDLIPPRAL